MHANVHLVILDTSSKFSAQRQAFVGVQLLTADHLLSYVHCIAFSINVIKVVDDFLAHTDMQDPIFFI